MTTLYARHHATSDTMREARPAEVIEAMGAHPEPEKAAGDLVARWLRAEHQRGRRIELSNILALVDSATTLDELRDFLRARLTGMEATCP
jgi:ATP-dependent exoDNAse (exonuclease V) beta subunit